MSIDEYYNKRKNLQVNEAKELASEYFAKYGFLPNKELMREFFWLFESEYNQLNSIYKQVFHLQGDSEKSIQKFMYNKPRFNSYDEFVKIIEGK